MANTCASSRGNTWVTSVIRIDWVYRMRRFFIVIIYTKLYYLWFIVIIKILGFWKLSRHFKIVIKYRYFKIASKRKNNFFLLTDTDAWKYRWQIGFETLLVYTVKYKYS